MISYYLLLKSSRIVFVFLGVCCCHCSDNYRFVEEEVRESGYLLRIKNFQRRAWDKQGQNLWDMKAKEAFLFQENIDDKTHIIAYTFSFHVSDPTTKSFLLEAGRGELSPRQGKLFLEEKVHYTDKQQLELHGEKMEYDLKKNWLSSQKMVQIKGSGINTICRKGMILNLKSDQQKCFSPQITNSPKENTSGIDAILKGNH